MKNPPTWTGDLPSGWTKRPLKFAVRLNPETLGEHTPPDFEFKYIDIGSVSSLGQIEDSEEIRFESAPSRARRLVREGDTILATVRTYLKAIALIDGAHDQAVASTGFAVLRPRPEILPDFLWRFVQSDVFVESVVAHSTGIGYPAIGPEALGSLPCLLPPITQQETIADFLDRETARIDDLIAQKERLLELLEEKRTALITRAVTKGLDPDVEMKDSGVEWLKEVPAHWDTLQLKHLWRQADYGLSTSLDGVGEVRVLTMGDIGDGQVRFPEEGHIDCKDVPRRLLLQSQDLLFNRTNSRDLVAKVGLVQELPEEPVSFASYLVRLRLRQKANPVYYNYLLNSRVFLKEAQSHALLSVNQANLNPTRYGALAVPRPPADEQQRIASYLNDVSDSIGKVGQTTKHAIHLLREYRSALISAAVTGKIDVREAAPHD